MQILGFEFPPELHYWPERDMWCQPVGDPALNIWRVGMTRFGVHLAGHFFMCRPKPVGTVVEQGQTIAVAELNKSVVTIKSPVSGRIVAHNALLQDRPEIVETECYTDGWLVDIEASDTAQDSGHWLHGGDWVERMTLRMRLENLDFSDPTHSERTP